MSKVIAMVMVMTMGDGNGNSNGNDVVHKRNIYIGCMRIKLLLYGNVNCESNGSRNDNGDSDGNKDGNG